MFVSGMRCMLFFDLLDFEVFPFQGFWRSVDRWMPMLTIPETNSQIPWKLMTGRLPSFWDAILFKCKLFQGGYTFFLSGVWLSNIWYVFLAFISIYIFSFYEHSSVMAPLSFFVPLERFLRCARWVWLEVLVFCLIAHLTEHPKPFCHFQKKLGAEREWFLGKIRFARLSKFEVKKWSWNWRP